MQRSYFSNVLGLTLIQGLNLVVPLLLIPVVINVQGIEAYGVYATVVAYYFFGSLVCDYGFDYSSVRALRHPDLGKTGRDRVVVGTLAAKWLLLAFAGPIAAIALATVARIDDLSAIFVGLLLPLTSVVSMHWLLLAEGRLVRLVIPMGVGRLVSIGLVLTIYPIWPSISLVLLLTAAPPLLVQTAFWIRETRGLQTEGRFPLEVALEAIRGGATAFYITFLTSYIAMSSTLAVSTFSALKEVGIFAATEKIVRAVFGIAKPFLVALYPEMSSLFHRSQPEWRKIVAKVIAIACVIGGLVTILIALWWTHFSILIFGEEVAGGEWIAYGFAAWLTIGLANNALGIQGLIASGHELAYAKAASAAAVVLTIGYLVLASSYGAIGIVLAMLVSESCLLLLNARTFTLIKKGNAS